MDIAKEILLVARAITSGVAEGEWATKWTPDMIDGKGILGLDIREHTNAGFKLVRMPSQIFRALVAVGIQKDVTYANTDQEYWTIIVPANNKVDLRGGDLKAWMSAGWFGFRPDGGNLVLWFKA